MTLPPCLCTAAFLALLMTAPALHAQAGGDARFQHIRKLYAATESALKNCTIVERDIEGESTEGGKLTAYLRNGTGKDQGEAEVLKLEAIYYGESGKASEEFYLEDGRVAFILRTDSTYDQPLSGVVKSRTEERFYFAKGELISWLDETKKRVPLPSATASERAQELLDRARRLLELARQPAAAN